MTQSTDAQGFLIHYASRHKREPFSPEDVISAAEVVDIRFQDQRAWGTVFSQCARDGYIRRAGLFPRTSSHLAVRPGWLGV